MDPDRRLEDEFPLKVGDFQLVTHFSVLFPLNMGYFWLYFKGFRYHQRINSLPTAKPGATGCPVTGPGALQGTGRGLTTLAMRLHHFSDLFLCKTVEVVPAPSETCGDLTIEIGI